MRLISLVILFLVLTVNIYAAESYFLSTELITFSQGIRSLTFEWKPAGVETESFDLGLGYGSYSEYFGETRVQWDADDYAFTIAYHRYINGKEIKGFCWGPRMTLDYTKAKASFTQYDYTYTNGRWLSDQHDREEYGNKLFYIPALELGYKWIFPYGIGLYANGLIGYISGDFKVSDKQYPVSNDGFYGFGVNLGYAW